MSEPTPDPFLGWMGKLAMWAIPGLMAALAIWVFEMDSKIRESTVERKALEHRVEVLEDFLTERQRELREELREGMH